MLGCFAEGNIFNDSSKKIIHYRVTSIKDLAKIIDHLDKYPLITQKQADYKLFKLGYNMMVNKEHLTLIGVLRPQKIVGLKASMNLGLSDQLKTAFPNVIPENRPLVQNQTITDPNWLAGFAKFFYYFSYFPFQENNKITKKIKAEGCFFYRYG